MSTASRTEQRMVSVCCRGPFQQKIPVTAKFDRDALAPLTTRTLIVT